MLCFVLFFFFWLAKQWVSLELFTKRIGSSWISHFYFYLAIGRFYARDVKVVYDVKVVSSRDDFNVLDNFNVASIKMVIIVVRRGEYY